MKNFKIVQKTPLNVGRCVHCDARGLCGVPSRFSCKCDMDHHYKDVNKERKLKLLKLSKI